MWKTRKHSAARRAIEGPAQASWALSNLPLRHVTTVATGVAFTLVLIVLLGTGNPPLPYRRGQVVKSEIRARAPFSIVDQKSTEAAREAAWNATPSVYRADRSAINRSVENLKEALAVMRAVQRFEDIDPAKAQSLAITREFFTSMRPLIANWTDEQVLQAVSGACDAIVKRGTLSLSEARAEFTRTQANGVIILDGPQRYYQVLSELLKPEDVEPVLRTELRQGLENPQAAAALSGYLSPVKPFLTYDEAQTRSDKEAARDSVKPVERAIDRWDVMVYRDTVLDNPEIQMLQKEQSVYLENVPPRDRFLRLTGLAITITLLVLILGAYIARYEPRVFSRRTRMIVLMLLAVLLVATARFFVRSSLSAYFIPLSLFAMAVGIAYDPLFAIGYALFLTILVGIATGSDFALAVSLFLGATVGILVIGRVRSRTTPFLAGLAAGAGTLVAVWGTGLLLHADYRLTLEDSFHGLVGGIAAGVVMTVMLPYVERGFKVVTDLSLLELLDLNKPILRRLALEAPGTYNHSLFVGNLADAAAEAIGANRLLARAGGYYHDVGKLAKAEYFVENAGPATASRHYNLSPTMSALVIISHVKDAVEFARQYRLPARVTDIIREHHGTTLVEYFYREAMDQAEDARQVNDQSFRYPGPKPHSREAAIVLLADCVESASRTITDPTPGKLENLVSDITRSKLSDGQFDDCNITMAELRQVEISLTKSLAGIFHSRIKYPGREL